jgi:hypothetical protein
MRLKSVTDVIKQVDQTQQQTFVQSRTRRTQEANLSTR